MNNKILNILNLIVVLTILIRHSIKKKKIYISVLRIISVGYHEI